jgi:hypothetical protein
LTDVG